MVRELLQNSVCCLETFFVLLQFILRLTISNHSFPLIQIDAEHTKSSLNSFDSLSGS